MADRTKIAWADATWSPFTGCTKVSEACEHCYAERMAGRNLPATRCPECHGVGEMTYMGSRDPGSWQNVSCDGCHGTGNVGFTPTFHPDRLDKPLHWRKPRRIFVCSMSDLFHEAFTDEQIDEVFNVFAAAPQHTYMVLTKRPERARDFIGMVHPNLWLGVTAENQQRYNERAWILAKTPAAVRFVSMEPLLGPIDQSEATVSIPWAGGEARGGRDYSLVRDHIDWVILGGESGPGARPMQPEWALDVYRQCKAAGVPFFFKTAKWAPQDGKYLSIDAADINLLPQLREMVLTRELPS